MDVARKHLWVACESYRRQMARTRHFLHARPHDARTWHDERIKALLAQRTVLRGKRPVCKWSLDGAAHEGSRDGG
eukprot:9121296-Pyramimonas_sp.AAC.1